ncbi:MAG: GDP-mannose 4,6-dehydratase [Desulfobacteraceae bacterium]|nr:GDP-mannose 4,6-dehydratase [Desulfobacteraceae bacterium]
MKRALITGPFGQDGSYLCELLAEHAYEVHGIIREPLSENSEKIKNYLASKSIEPIVHYCDLNEYDDVKKTIEQAKPAEIYHLAATHFSSELSTESRDRSLYQNSVSVTFNILTAANEVQQAAKIVVAGSCLMFDASDVSPQNENTPFKTRSYYGLAKTTDNQLVIFFRHKGMHVSMAIFYNHESPRRRNGFVTSKIVKNMVSVAKGEIGSFELGDLNAIKDWGYAKDYVYGIWLMAQQSNADDYIFATGKGRTIRDFVDRTAGVLNISDWQQHVAIRPELVVRKLEIDLVGDPSHATRQLSWNHSISFHQLVDLMVKNELSGQLD